MEEEPESKSLGNQNLQLPRKSVASAVRASPPPPNPYLLWLTSSTATSSIRPSSCTTFPTDSTSPHRGSSSVCRGWRGLSALDPSHLSLRITSIHHTPTLWSPGQGRVGGSVSMGLTKKPQEALTVGASGNLRASTAVGETEADQMGHKNPPRGAPGLPDPTYHTGTQL